MVSPTTRRPLPAAILLVTLTLLTALVWWRVLHRDSGNGVAKPQCSSPAVPDSALPRPASVAVSVLNSTTRTGIARATATKLTNLGFKVAGFGNDNPKVHVAGVAEIRFGPEQKKDASLLAFYFDGAKMVALKADPAGKVVVSLGRKFKAVATSKAAVAAMQAAHITLVPVNGTPTTASANC